LHSNNDIGGTRSRRGGRRRKKNEKEEEENRENKNPILIFTNEFTNGFET